MSILFNFTDSQLFNSNIEIISSLFFANINRENALLCMTPTELRGIFILNYLQV